MSEPAMLGLPDDFNLEAGVAVVLRKESDQEAAVTKLENMTEPQLHKFMRLCAKAVEGAAQVSYVEKPLFALILFNDPKIGQYICNCQRKEMIAALRETADRLERNLDIPRSSTGVY